jgi:hypothetical protein
MMHKTGKSSRDIPNNARAGYVDANPGISGNGGAGPNVTIASVGNGNGNGHGNGHGHGHGNGHGNGTGPGVANANGSLGGGYRPSTVADGVPVVTIDAPGGIVLHHQRMSMPGAGGPSSPTVANTVATSPLPSPSPGAAYTVQAESVSSLPPQPGRAF